MTSTETETKPSATESAVAEYQLLARMMIAVLDATDQLAEEQARSKHDTGGMIQVFAATGVKIKNGPILSLRRESLPGGRSFEGVAVVLREPPYNRDACNSAKLIHTFPSDAHRLVVRVNGPDSEFFRTLYDRLAEPREARYPAGMNLPITADQLNAHFGLLMAMILKLRGRN